MPPRRAIRKLGIRGRLLVASLLPMAVFALFAAWLWGVLGDLGRDVESTTVTEVAFALQAKDLQRNVVQVQQYLSDIFATRGLDGLADGFDEAKKNSDQFRAGVARFRDYLAQRGEKALLEKLDRAVAAFDVYYKTGVAMAEAYVRGGPSEGNPMMPGFDKANQALQESLGTFVTAEIDALQATSGGTTAQADFVRRIAVPLCAPRLPPVPSALRKRRAGEC